MLLFGTGWFLVAALRRRVWTIIESGPDFASRDGRLKEILDRLAQGSRYDLAFRANTFGRAIRTFGPVQARNAGELFGGTPPTREYDSLGEALHAIRRSQRGKLLTIDL